MRKAAGIAFGLLLAGFVCLAQAQMPNVQLLGACSQLGNDQFTKLLVHADGTNGSTAFKDNSTANHAITAHGAAQVSTSEKAFGNGSAALGGASGNYLSSPDSTDWTFGTGDFTVDMRLRFTSTSSLMAIAFQLQGNDGWFAFFNTSGDGKLHFLGRTNSGATSTGSFEATPSFSTNVWYHVAFVRSGSSGLIFQNGALLATTVTAPLTTFVDVAAELDVGGVSIASPAFEDEFRISKGIARWTSTFSPPVAAYCP